VSTYNVVAETNMETVVSEYIPDAKRSDAYQSEAELEAEFIRLLSMQGYGAPEIKTEQDLIDNLRVQLEALNKYKFTDDEWRRFFTANLANPNEGILEKTKKVQESDTALAFTTDAGRTQNIRLLDKKCIHNNSLQVINQYETESGKYKNRYDVTVLVNGLPLVHIELKRRGVAIREAFNQINRYHRESFWADSGLFEFVQIFVISNGTHTKYYSNTTRHLHVETANDFTTLTYENTLQIAEHIAPLVPPAQDEISAVRFDMLIYQIELAMLAAKSYKRAKNDLIKKTQELSKYATIPAVAEQSELIEQILHNAYLERAGVMDYERIRIKLRDLIKFIPPDERARYDTNFTDDMLSTEWNESQLDNDDLANYKKKVNYYIKQNESIPVIAKLKSNVPMTPNDVESLEGILWGELGTKEQYDAQYGKTPLGELVRSIVGLSQQAANDAFSEFLNDAELDSRQMHFVKQIVNYIVKNGMMKDLAILQESPFSDWGRVSELFDDMKVFTRLRTVIEGITANAAA